MNMFGTQSGWRTLGRVLVVTLCGALLCSTLTGCRSSRPKDGTYTARYQYPSNGYVEYLTVTFRDGRPTEVEFDAYLETEPETKKSELTREEYPMDPHPSEWMDDLEDNIEDAGLKPDRIATVAGATSSSRHARELYDAILTAAKDGSKKEIIVENEEEAPDSGTTGDSAGMNTDESGLVGDSGMINDSISDNAGMESNSSTIPGLDDTNSGSMDGSMNDSGINSGADAGSPESGSAGMGGTMTDSAGQENVTGGDGTGTGSSQSGSTGSMSASA